MALYSFRQYCLESTSPTQGKRFNFPRELDRFSGEHNRKKVSLWLWGSRYGRSPGAPLSSEERTQLLTKVQSLLTNPLDQQIAEVLVTSRRPPLITSTQFPGVNSNELQIRREKVLNALFRAGAAFGWEQ